MTDVYLRLGAILLGTTDEKLLVPERDNIIQFAKRAGLLRGKVAAEQFIGSAKWHFGPAQIVAIDDANLTFIGKILESINEGWVSAADYRMMHGIWDHFKGGIYRSMRTERDADSGKARVSYISMVFGTDHSRRAEEWNEVVVWPDGAYRSRFVFRGPDMNTPPPSFKVPTPKLPYET